MEKRLILAIVLSIAVLVAYQKYFMPEPPGPRPPAPASERVPAGREGPAASAGTGTAATLPPALGAGGRAAAPRTIRIETPLFSAALDTAGGGIASFRLKRYRDVQGPAGKPLEIAAAGGMRPRPFEVSFEGSRPPLTGIPVYASDAPGEIVLRPGERRTVVLEWSSPGGMRILREYTFSADAYDFGMAVAVENRGREPVELLPALALPQRYTGELAGDSYVFKGAVLGTTSGMHQVDLKKAGRGKVDRGPVAWAAADSKYFALIALPEKGWNLGGVERLGEDGVRITLAGPPLAAAPGRTVRTALRAFAGPKESGLLRQAGKGLDDLVDYGWFAFLAKPLVWLMRESHRVTRNYGLDIILLTILVKILFYPLTRRSLQSMKKMQDLAPVLAKIREKYKDDKARLNQETMNVYKTYKINPFSGCLPMLLQIPVFIALYKALLVTIELRHSPFVLWITDLSAPEHLWDLSVAGYVIPIRLLPLLMGISMYIQQKMTPSGGMEPAQQKVMLLMPVIFTVMFWGFPAGLVIYWLVNNVLSIGQQVLYNRQTAASAAGKG